MVTETASAILTVEVVAGVPLLATPRVEVMLPVRVIAPQPVPLKAALVATVNGVVPSPNCMVEASPLASVFIRAITSVSEPVLVHELSLGGAWSSTVTVKLLPSATMVKVPPPPGGAFTVTAHVAVIAGLLPITVAVMVAFPGATAVTRPALTVATAVSSDDQSMV